MAKRHPRVGEPGRVSSTSTRASFWLSRGARSPEPYTVARSASGRAPRGGSGGLPHRRARSVRSTLEAARFARFAATSGPRARSLGAGRREPA